MTKELRLSIGGGLACLLLLMLGTTSGCRKVPNGGIPIYVRVDSITIVSDDYTKTGSASHLVPDVWAESGATTLGAYEMPVSFPVLSQGDVPILLSAGIYDNGIISSRAAYPFYRSDTFTIHNAVPGQTYVRHPVYHYFADVQHGILQDFNNSTGFDAVMSFANDDADSLPNHVWRCAEIKMNTNDTSNLTVESNGTNVTTNGREAYIELDFKKSSTTENMPFDIGLIVTTATGSFTYYPIKTIFPHEYWKKNYLNVSSIIGNNGGANFKIYINAYKNPGTTGSVYIDNLKLLYFQ